jgi:ArsR family transcriptional regulator, arsenate/arsenite/antimonite-responsive transcriptional repressor
MLNYMPETIDKLELAQTFKALSHPKRLQIFDLLMEGVQCNCEISQRLGLSLSLISHHMRILEDAGLVRSERDTEDARWIYYAVDPVALRTFQDSVLALTDRGRIQPRQPLCGPQRCRSCGEPE